MVGVFDPFKIVVRDRPHIANDMGEILRQRIAARQAHIRYDTRKRQRVCGDLGHSVPFNAIRKGYRQERRAAFNLGQRAVQVFCVKLDQRRQPRNRCMNIVTIFGDDHNPIAGFVQRKRRAVAIKNLSTRRWDQAYVDTVFFGEQMVLVGLFNLQIPHPRRQSAREYHLPCADQKPSPRNSFGCGFQFFFRTPHARRLALVVSMSSGLRTRNTPEMMATTTG